MHLSLTREEVAKQFLTCMQVEPTSLKSFPTEFLDHMVAQYGEEDIREVRNAPSSLDVPTTSQH
jgi:hypothetical protein